MTPGIYLQRRRDKLGRSAEEVAVWLKMELVARGVSESLQLNYSVEMAVRLIEHDIMIATPAIAEALGAIPALAFDPAAYFALVEHCDHPALIAPPAVCRSCGEALELPDARICDTCEGWGGAKMRLARALDHRQQLLAGANCRSSIAIEETERDLPAD